MYKCVFVIGPESSGSKLVAKICSHVLGVEEYGAWDGSAWSDRGEHKVCHRSLPYSDPPQYPDILKWIKENGEKYQLFFVITTRDITISEISRSQRWSKPFAQSDKESQQARQIIASVLDQPLPSFIWSYETFMYLQEIYLKSLYKFLGVDSEFVPTLIDGNINKILPTP